MQATKKKNVGLEPAGKKKRGVKDLLIAGEKIPWDLLYKSSKKSYNYQAYVRTE